MTATVILVFIMFYKTAVRASESEFAFINVSMYDRVQND